MTTRSFTLKGKEHYIIFTYRPCGHYSMKFARYDKKSPNPQNRELLDLAERGTMMINKKEKQDE